MADKVAFRWPGAAEDAIALADCAVRSAEALAITGPNGSGKTTLALLLAGLLRPRLGTVILGEALAAGRGHEAIAAWRARSRLGLGPCSSPEHQFLSARSRRAAARAATHRRRRGVAQRRADELLERLDLGHLAQANPFTLSGGEQRRLSVATALRDRTAPARARRADVRPGPAHVGRVGPAAGGPARRRPRGLLRDARSTVRQRARRSGHAARGAALMRLFTPIVPDPRAALVGANPVAKLLAALVLLATSSHRWTGNRRDHPRGPPRARAVLGHPGRLLVQRTWLVGIAAVSIAVVNTLFAAEQSGPTVIAIGPIRVDGIGLAIRLLAIVLAGLLATVTSEPVEMADALVQQAQALAALRDRRPGHPPAAAADGGRMADDRDGASCPRRGCRQVAGRRHRPLPWPAAGPVGRYGAPGLALGAGYGGARLRRASMQAWPVPGTCAGATGPGSVARSCWRSPPSGSAWPGKDVASADRLTRHPRRHVADGLRAAERTIAPWWPPRSSVSAPAICRLRGP